MVHQQSAQLDHSHWVTPENTGHKTN